MLRGIIQRPIAVGMFFLALVLIGGISSRRIPVDLLPSITYPRLTIITAYGDVPAEDLERLVTRPLEEVVTALTGVRRVVARTREGVSLITVEYEWGTQMEFANLHLREAIDRVAFREDFPEAADRPLILRWDPTARPIGILVLKGEEPIEELTDFAREVLKPALEQVDGISQAEVVGGADREILVQPDLEKLRIYGVTLEEIRRALAASNVSFPGGKIRRGPLHLSLRIAGEYESIQEIASTEIPLSGRSSIRVSDVAEVRETAKRLEGITLLDGETVVSILIYKEPEANTILATDRIDQALGVLRGDYGRFQYAFVYRDADFVRASFSGLVQSILLGSLLAFLVLVVFLRDLRSPLVIGVSIPVSIAITLALLYFGKVKLNLMSLGGISLAAGMLVDNAIVVLENIHRHIRSTRDGGVRESGSGGPEDRWVSAERKRMAEGAERGTAEVARAVLASTLTTIAVFFPVVYVPGIAGEFFRDQALSVTFALVISIASALVLQPVLAARILHPAATDGPRALRFSARTFENLYRLHHLTLEYALRHRGACLAAILLFLVAAGIVGARLPRSFMPERTSGDMRLDLELPAGTPLEETRETAARVSRWLGGDPHVRACFAQIGRTERTLAAVQEYSAPNTARLRIFLEPGRDAYRHGARIRYEIDARLKDLPEVNASFRDEGVGLAEVLATGEAPFTMGVLAENPRDALDAAEKIAAKLSEVPGLSDLRTDRVLGTPNLVLRLRREEILRSGLNPEAIAQEVRNRIGGIEATTFNEVEQRIDIAVRLSEEERLDLAVALLSPVEVPGGATVPLRSFLAVDEEIPVRELVRRNQRRMVTVTGEVAGRSVDAVWRDAVGRIDALDLPEEATVLRGGEDAAMRESFRDLLWAMLLAVLLVYMILAAQFESFLDPLLIAAVLPIGLAGSALAIFATRGSVNILSLIGVVALLGIAVNDAIVKVDTIRRLRGEGMEGHDAVLEASRLRLRPILMTSVTTILAMLPMAIGLGSGEQLQRPLAVTIIGGLAVTTLVTLIYTPILYEAAHRVGIRDRRA